MACKKSWLLVVLFGITVLFSACGQQTAKQLTSPSPLLSNSLQTNTTPTATPAPIQITVKRQEMAPTATP
ncbi:MAG: hypothetical protein JO215_12900, partial [Ktedonobacteraceae bacterium]|nr:hypothetical protein [Ktedonobacteraceae bacterium]